MVFQAYIDDSYKADGVYVLAGHIASAEVWAKFSKEWEEMLPFAIRAKDGGFHFKMSEMMAIPERAERVGAFYRLIENSDIISISCKINIRDLKRAKERLFVFRNKIDWTVWNDPFFFTFRALIDCVHAHRHSMPSLPQDEKIDFIFDEQSQKSIILSAWDQFLISKEPSVRAMFGATPRFEDDRDFLPIQAADLWAWWVRQWYEDNCPVQEGNQGIIMGLRNAVESKKIHQSIFIRYSEEQIIENLKRRFP